MRWWRVTWVADRWEVLGADQPGHPRYVARDRQGAGRFDNPAHYAALYLCRQPEGAIGEIIGNHPRVDDGTFVWRDQPELRRRLVAVEIPDDTVLLDLDDAATLGRLALRPSDVVRRHRDLTRKVALGRYLRRADSAEAGICWWSYHHPDWTPAMLWSGGRDDGFGHVEMSVGEPLEVTQPDVVVAAEMLRRPIVTPPR
jgi:hypothetical protein